MESRARTVLRGLTVRLDFPGSVAQEEAMVFRMVLLEVPGDREAGEETA